MIPVTIVARRSELPPEQRIWGTGGWLMPSEREALDWLTLAILLGWDPVIAYDDETLRDDVASASRVIVIATNPVTLADDTVTALRRATEIEGAAVIATAAAPGSPWAAWASADATSSGPGLVTRTPRGAGQVITLGFHPSEFRDASEDGTRTLRDLLLTASPRPVEWVDLAGVMILRMDDPGGAQNVYCREWCYPKLTEEAWDDIGRELRARDARMSIGYTPGWLDDGEAERGRLWVDGHEPARVPGRVHPSRLVRYHDVQGLAPGRVDDYEAEYRGIRRLMQNGVLSPELHGFTHIHPDTSSWLGAGDRHESASWFRELGRGPSRFLAGRPRDQHPIYQGVTEFRASFDADPTTLICPGDEFTDASLEVALDLGIRLIGSYYLGIRWRDRFCWCTHVCAPYLDEADARWTASGLPVVGYFHDKEPSEDGVGWLRRHLEAWERCGVRQFTSFAWLAGKIGSSHTGDAFSMSDVRSTRGSDLVRVPGEER